MSKKNLLIISDFPSGSSGLARITRDLALRIHDNLSDLFRLGVAGVGGCGSSKFGFPQYHLEGVQSDWVLPSLQEIVEDFAGKERCTIMFVWDASRLGWFSQPDRLGNETLTRYPGMREWLLSANIEKWLYCPLDASGPNDKLTFPLALTLMGFDRLLAYGPFGEGVIRKTIGDEESNKRHLTNLPHGIDSNTFFPLDRKLCRRLFLKHTGAQSMFNMFKQRDTPPIAEDDVVVSIIGTNQSRKNWALGIEAASILAQTHKIRLWLHTDSLERYWSIPSLLVDYGLIGKEMITLGYLSDRTMTEGYNASDIVLGIAPEGFGYVHAEAMACRVPCITGSYAGGAVLVDPNMLVDPIGFYKEGSYSSLRPVYRAEDWAAKAEEWVGKRASLDLKYEWANNWKAWESWFREAAK
jgi:glycosyltransferase involved in cell wall biosynthesis